ncbi:MAG: hypothetical protein KDE51_17500, partial [Anaerolineales bacterium]|nr:hypothetical protein [Anaerolineales bacterium]
CDPPPATGTIIVIKDTIPDGPQDFSFSTTGGLSPVNFDLDDDADGTLSNSQTFNVPVGSYQVTQATVPGYTTVLSCVSNLINDFNNTTSVLTGNIELDADETVTCTFTSVPTTSTDSCANKNGLIEHLPTPSTSFNPANPNIISAGQSFTVPAGVTEVDGIDIYFNYIYGGSSLILTLYDGPAVGSVGTPIATATYSNPGAAISTGADNFPISFEFETPVSLTPGNVYYYLVRYTYPAPGFAAVTSDLYSGGNHVEERSTGLASRSWDAKFSVYACVESGSITIMKETDIESDLPFEFDGDFFFNLKDGESEALTDLEPGEYNFWENLPQGWDLDNISCDTQEGITVDLDAEKVTIDLQ